MEKIAGYARIYAQAWVQKVQFKSWLRKPHLKFTQCFTIAGYFHQLGAILAAKYRDRLDQFGYAFLGAIGETGAFRRFAESAIEKERAFLDGATSFLQYLAAEQMKRFGFKGEFVEFYSEFAMKKIPTDLATELAWQLAMSGTVLGAMRPDAVRVLFENTYKDLDPTWDAALSAGLEIPHKQEHLTYDQAESEHDRQFLEYARECCSSTYQVLTSR